MDLDRWASHSKTWQGFFSLIWTTTRGAASPRAGDRWPQGPGPWEWPQGGGPQALGCPRWGWCEWAALPGCVWGFSFLTCPPPDPRPWLRFMCRRHAHPGSFEKNIKQIPRIGEGGQSSVTLRKVRGSCTRPPPGQGASWGWSPTPFPASAGQVPPGCSVLADKRLTRAPHSNTSLPPSSFISPLQISPRIASCYCDRQFSMC